jgi:hypothetical protein
VLDFYLAAMLEPPRNASSSMMTGSIRAMMILLELDINASATFDPGGIIIVEHVSVGILEIVNLNTRQLHFYMLYYGDSYQLPLCYKFVVLYPRCCPWTRIAYERHRIQPAPSVLSGEEVKRASDADCGVQSP